MRKLCFIIIFIGVVFLFCTNYASAAHYIVGRVNNSRDGTSANGLTVVLWKTSVGITDNITDIIGPSGNSGVSNTYFIDCELLGDACGFGNEVAVKVIDGNFSENRTLVVSGAGFDVMGDLILNSAPSISMRPLSGSNRSSPIGFNCSVSDPDSNLKNVTLFGNWSGGWHANESVSISGGSSSNVFTKSLNEGAYTWACLAYDSLGARIMGQNMTLEVDSTPPNVSAVYTNTSEICNNYSVRAFCNVSDFRLQNVIIQVKNSSGAWSNYTALFSGSNYYSDITLNSSGTLEFGCWANDSAGNFGNKSGTYLTSISNIADVVVDSLVFGNYSPKENEIVRINATLRNIGCAASGNFLTGFYRGDSDSGGQQIGLNVSASLAILESTVVYVNWSAVIGNSTIFTKADVGGVVNELNETNNKNNRSIDVLSWMYLYGNVTINKVLATGLFGNLSFWANETNFTGNIFVADTESKISWDKLQAIGRDSVGGVSSNDLENIDFLMGMAGFNDSVANTFASAFMKNFTVYQREIENVLVVNSTNNPNFLTGILWDMGDDSNGEFDVIDAEDLVFVGEVNLGKTGYYGNYDYEIKIPARLRSYRGPNNQDVYLYYELK